MVVITPKAVSETLSRRGQMKATTAENRLARVDRFLTIIGDKEVKPNHECSISIPNNTCKIVLQMQERFASAGAFSNAKAAPKAFFSEWASLLTIDTEILYVTSTFLKEAHGQEWLEACATIRKRSLQKDLGAFRAASTLYQTLLGEGCAFPRKLESGMA